MLFPGRTPPRTRRCRRGVGAAAAAAAWVLVMVMVASAGAAPAPTNDDFLDALNLNAPGTALPVATRSDTQETNGATTQANLLSPCGFSSCRAGPPELTTCGAVSFGKTVWYDFYPDHSGQIEIQTAGIPNVIALYSYDPRSFIPHEVQCAPGSTFASNELSANVTAGLDYTYSIGGRGGVGGSLQTLFSYADSNLTVAPFRTRAFFAMTFAQPGAVTLARLQFIGLVRGERIAAGCAPCQGASFGSPVVEGNTEVLSPSAPPPITTGTRLLVAASSPAWVGRFKIYGVDLARHRLPVVADGCLAPGTPALPSLTAAGRSVTGAMPCPRTLLNPAGAEYVFWSGQWGGLWERFYAARHWAPPIKLRTVSGVNSEPAVAVQASGQQDVFWKGRDGSLWETWYTGAWRRGAKRLGASGLVSGPAAGVDGAGDEFVFWQGPGGVLFEKSYSGGTWSEAVPVPAGVLGSAPAVTVRPDGEQDVFWRGTDGHLWETSYTGHWAAPVQRGGGMLGSAPSVAGDGAGNEYVVWQGTDGGLWEQAYVNRNWLAPVRVRSGHLGSPPTIVVHANGEQDVFWRGGDGHLWETWALSGRWTGPFRLGSGRLGSAPSAGIDAAGKQGGR